MEVAKLIVDLIGKLAWPIITLTIALVFKKQIVGRIKDIKELELPGGFKAKLNEEKIKAISEETTDELKVIDESANIGFEEKVKLKEEFISEQIKRISDPNDGIEKKNTYQQDEFNSKDRTLLAFTAKDSLTENLKYNIYYDPSNRNHNSPFRYIGLYYDKAIVAVGKVDKIVACNYDNGNLVDNDGNLINILTEDERNRIIGIIENTQYYEIKKGHKFFLVDKFYNTYFEKVSDYPIRSKKYFWLDEIEGFKMGMTSEKLAKLLDKKEWE